MPAPPKPPLKVSALRRIAAALGPGVITGAADDDPSGIATYSIAGAQFGTKFLWTAPVLWPLMAAVQMMCARIGLVTGRGLAGALRQKYPRRVVAIAAGALFIANTINVGADLGGMADAAHLLTGVPSSFWVLVFGIGITIATIRLRYAVIANTLKWLALILVVYVVAAIDVHPDWGTVIRSTFVPSLPHSREAWATLVAILGTTISPYLFFWQASQEVEEEKAAGQLTLRARRGATATQIGDRKIDIGLGTFFSNMAMFFIIVTTASTLNANGQTELATSADVAAALRPLAGRFAMLLYTIGIVGTGLLAIPTLAGSAAYAFAETFNWRQGIDAKFTRASAFYAVVGISITIGVLMDSLGIGAVKALYWTAVINGLLAPFLLVGILHTASDRKLMHGQPSSMLGRVVVGVTTVVMFAAGIAMFLVPRTAGAQQRGEAPTTVGSGTVRYRAVVRDWSGRPVPNARARMLGHRFALTDEGGSVVLDSLRAGSQTLEVLAVGYFPDRRLVEVRADQAPADTIILTALQSALDTVRVTAGRGVSGFDARRRGTVGQFITAADIERENPKNTTSLLRTRDGLRYTFDRGGNPFIAMTAGPGRACRPAIFVDGFPPRWAPPAVAGAASLNWLVHPEEIGGVEIYNSPAMVPAQFVDPGLFDPRRTCGVILFWTREKLGMRKAPLPSPP